MFIMVIIVVIIIVIIIIIIIMCFIVDINCVTLHCARLSKFRMADEVKQKVLTFLLQNADDLLLTSGCPIKKVNKHVVCFL